MNGGRWHAYDVWADVLLPDATERLATRLAPHTAWVVALRTAVAYPQVVGTTRHVVQGAVDLSTETWDAATRTLKGRSVNLDGRPYAVTIAVPQGLRPGECTADLPCVVRTSASGHAVIEWADGSQGKDIEWELSFRKTPRR
jgi:hypothetical protein